MAVGCDVIRKAIFIAILFEANPTGWLGAVLHIPQIEWACDLPNFSALQNC